MSSQEPNPTPDSSPAAPPAPAVPAAPAASAAPAAKQENPLLNLMLNVLAPVTVLSYCSKEGDKLWHLGPRKALIVAVALPVIYQIYDWTQRKKLNTFSIIGFVSVLLTGGLGLLKLGAPVFAAKEAAIPLIFAAIVYFSGMTGKPIVNLFLLNEDLMDVKKVQKAVDSANQRQAFQNLLKSSTLILTGSFLISSVLNYIIAYQCIKGTVPDTPAYTEAIGKQNLWSALIIIPISLVFLMWIFFRFFKKTKELTGLDRDDILLPR